MKGPTCIVRLDRIQLLAWPKGRGLPAVPGFETRSDFFVRKQTSIVTYRRVRTSKNPVSDTTLSFQHWAACPWLAPVKLTVTAEDRKGLSKYELGIIVNSFKRTRLLLVELALDFSPESGVDRTFLLSHGIFGKSQLACDGSYLRLVYGGRKSDKLVRCYWKESVASFRVEFEFHSRLLRTNRIVAIADLARLADFVHLNHVRFVRINWEKLRNYLSDRTSIPDVSQKACSQRHAIHRTLKFLRNEAGVRNIHRFLVPLLTLNRDIQKALRYWSRNFQKVCSDTFNSFSEDER